MPRSRKNFVIDTSVLVYHEDAVHAFPNNNLYIPITVLEELDNLKTRNDKVGNAARYVNRFLDSLRESGNFSKGIALENGQKIFVISEVDEFCLPDTFERKNDNKILACAVKLKESKKNVIFLSRDISQRVKADVLGVKSENYSKDKAVIDRKGAYTGVSVLDFDLDQLEKFHKDHRVKYEGNLMPNEFVVLKGGQSSGLGIYKNSMIHRLTYTAGRNFAIENIEPRNKEQTFAMEMLLDPSIHMVTITGMAGSGKTLMTCAAAIHHLVQNNYEKVIISRPVKSMSADIGFLPGPQPLDAKILTPEGWTTMGEIKVGDYVISRDGSKTKVLKIFPKGKKDVYRLTTTSGISAESCGDHIWATKDFEEKKRGKSYSLKTLNEVKETLKVVKNKKEKLNHYLPRNEAVCFNEKEVDISPYALGVMIGKKPIDSACHTKFIPDNYKYNSKEVRIEIIRGLMDSNGTVNSNGKASFATTSLKLAEDIIEITRSLGGRAKMRSKNEAEKISYKLNINLPEKLNPFLIETKANRYSQKYIHDDRIESVEYVGEKEVQCILVDHPEHLYITNDFIVTHNTKEEKMRSWVQPFFDNFGQIFKKNGYSNVSSWIESGAIEIEALSFIRGRSLPNTIFILDEAQNISYHEAKAVLTRMGENSKIILLGDLEQIDAPHLDASTSGLSSVVELFKDFKLSGHITLLKGERSPLASHAAKIL